MNCLSIEEILKVLPHRYPFLMIDCVTRWTPFEEIWAQKNITINEPYFTGHFPNHPVMPGVMIIEALAQAAGILAYYSEKKTHHDYLFYLASVNNVKFKQRVIPGDTLDLHIKFNTSRLNFVKVSGTAYVKEKIVCCADFVSAKGI